MTTNQLMAGYARYTTAEEFGAAAKAVAPGTTPILSFIGVSSGACGGLISVVSGVSIADTVHAGC